MNSDAHQNRRRRLPKQLLILRMLARPAFAIAASIAIVAIVLLALGASPIAVAETLVEGAFGSWLAFTETLVRSTPLIFTGLAVAIAFEGAIWNIGADGQLIMGALAAGAIGPMLGGWPHLAAVAIVLAIGAAAGAVWGAICGWLKAARNVSEIISTIMLNFVAAQLIAWAVHGPLIQPSRAYPASAPIADAARFAHYFFPSRMNFGMAIALACAIACQIALFHTTWGFKVRAIGRNVRAARFFGIATARLTVAVMALAGALAGLGGAVQVAAYNHRLYENFSPGWGYEAIAVALVARLSPIGIIPCAILFGALDNGSQSLQSGLGVSPEIVNVIEALIILILLAIDSSTFAARRIGDDRAIGDDAAAVDSAPVENNV
jgi:simple sugar transport system permease protein